MVLKLKPSEFDHPSPYSWNGSPPNKKPPSFPDNLPQTPTAWLSAGDMKLFGAQPLRNEIGFIRCRLCEKPVLASAIKDHDDTCKRVRSGNLKKGARGFLTSGSSMGMKRKALDDADADSSLPAKKKSKVTTGPVTGSNKAKARIKGPADLDRHCCVINDKGVPCSRSLTCKSHPMGAKRAVQGRSKDYDELLLDWNRAFNPKFVEPVKRETKAERKEKKDKEKAEKKERDLQLAALNSTSHLEGNGALRFSEKKKKKSSSKKAAVTAANARLAMGDDGMEDYDNVDSEAEVDALVHALVRSRNGGLLGIPMALPCDTGSWFIGRRERLRNCHDLVSQALGALGPPSSTRSSFTSTLRGLG